MQICRLRLANQFLTTAGPKTGSEVVRALGAVQAQDYSGAKWALAQRTRGATDTDIERELTEGRILRTHVLRPTWHFVTPGDIRWMLALTAPRVSAAMAYYNRRLELTAAVFRRSSAAIAKALRGGKDLTRADLRGVLERARIGKVTGQRLGHLMMQAELDAVICSGPRRGKQFTHALLEERVAPAPAMERDEALLELTRRYFATRGPASIQDFAWWSGLSMADARRGIEIAGRDLRRIAVGGKSYRLDAQSQSVPRASPSAHLLPNYDEYFIGYADRGAIAERIGNTKAVSGGNALLNHVIVVDGQLVGGWKRVLEKGRVVVEIDLAARLTATEKRRVAAAADRFGAFLGLPAHLEVRAG